YAAYTQKYNRPRLVVEMMGLTYIDQWQTAAAKNLSFQSSKTEVVDIRGYDYQYQDLGLNTWDTVKTLAAGETQWLLTYSPSALTIRLSEKQKTNDDIVFDLRPTMNGLEEDYGKVAYATNIPPSRMSITQSSRSSKVNLHFDSMVIEKAGERYKGNYLQVDVLIGHTRD
ncbi:MAG TPA: hypothetical protein VI758_06365, partial [Bacteroidota bacterium]